MKKSKFTEEQIVFALKEHQQGTKVEVIARKLGISPATFYNLKVIHSHTPYKVSARRACRLVRLRRATFCYQSKRPEQAYLRKRIKEIATEKPQYGYRRITILIRREGLPVNTKRVYRIYKEEGLQMRKKVPKRRVSPQLRQIRVPAAKQNQCWSMDFVFDNLYNG
jgi:putative transposase